MTEPIDPRLVEFANLMTSTEPLHPDLIPYFKAERKGGLGWAMLRHPLVCQVPFNSNGLANFQYEQKKKAVDKALSTSNYEQFVFLHERPYRIEAFQQIRDNLTDTQYWKILGGIWTDTENQHANLRAWKDLIGSNRPHRQYLMNEDEDNLLRSLPDEVTIYRGCTKGLNENGLSWTLNKEKAQWFSTRLLRKGATPIVLERTVPKSDIIALFNGRNEFEVVYIPKRGK